jgi:hypothetical protein
MEHKDAIRSGAAERYLLDEMNDADRDDYEAHFLSCPQCARDVRVGSEFIETSRAFFRSSQSRRSRPKWLITIALKVLRPILRLCGLGIGRVKTRYFV